MTVAVLAVTVLLPVLPTLLIYKLLPGNSVAVSGPFKGLTIKAAGAFAAYFITFVAMTPFSWRTFNIVTAMLSPTWTVTGQIVALDPQGQAISNPRLFDTIEVKLRPENFNAAEGKLWIKIPEVDKRIPGIHLTIPQFGSTIIRLTDDQNPSIQFERDEGKREIRIVSDVYIQQLSDRPYSPSESGLGPPATTVPPAPVSESR